MSELLDLLLDRLDAHLPAAIGLRHELHAAPELGNEEHDTATRIEKALANGLDTTRPAGTALVVAVGPARTPAVALRAELDGLPITERTNAPFSATSATMHACGHDVHMAALVAVLQAAAELSLPARLVGVFQPSEETYPSGAERLVRDGVLGRWGVEAVLGLHVHPEVPWGAVAAAPGAINASSDTVVVTIHGDGGHAAYPHRTRDPVIALSAVVLALQQLVSRRADPMSPTVLTLSQLHAGTADNIIPDTARASGTLRVLEAEQRDACIAAIRDIAQHTARAHGCDATVEVRAGEPALVNDDRLATAFERLLPQAGLSPAEPMRSCGSDDFGYYRQAAPTLMGFVGLAGHPAFHPAPLHHPRFLPPDETVTQTAHALAVAYCSAAELLTS